MAKGLIADADDAECECECAAVGLLPVSGIAPRRGAAAVIAPFLLALLLFDFMNAAKDTELAFDSSNTLLLPELSAKEREDEDEEASLAFLST
jgi:hypothetical protein